MEEQGTQLNPEQAPIKKSNPKRLALYGFFAIVILFFIVIILVIQSGLNNGSGFRLPVRPDEQVTEKVKADRLAIMNLLNEFNQSQNQPAEDATQAERDQLNIAQIDRVLTRLTKVQPDVAVVPARDDLISAFTTWKEVIEGGNDARRLKYVRDTFKKVAADYDWLTTVMWIIILNRL